VTAAGLRATEAIHPLRLTRLYLASRQVLVALAVLVASGLVLRASIQFGWVEGDGPLAQAVPLPIEGAAAVVIALTVRSPFGELERTVGRALAWLRLGTALTLTAASAGILAAGTAGAHLPGGNLEVLRSVAGMSGVGLLAAAVLGGSFAWVGPVAYMCVAEYALSVPWTTPWIWSGRPPHDQDAAICAALVFVAGLVVIGVRGASDSKRD
jgi:hypothetical protein